MASENEGSEEYKVSTTQSSFIVEAPETGITRQMSNLILSTSIRLFSYTDIERATNYLSESSRMGSWRYGRYYKGYLHDGTKIYIKMLDPKFPQDEADFVQELNVLEDLRHPNLAELVGACIEHHHHAVLYKFPAYDNLELCLEDRPGFLTWQIRTSIIHQICSALIFLYSNKRHPIIHGHLTPANILIEANFNCRVSIPEGTATSNPNPVGRFTEYIETENRKLGDDMYSLGIMVLRLLTGLSDATIEGQAHGACIGQWLTNYVDHRAGNWPPEVAEELAYFGAKCCNSSKSNLLRMEEIMKELGNFLAMMDNFKNKESLQQYSKNMLDEETRRHSYGTTSYDRRSEPNKSTITFFDDIEIYAATDSLSDSCKIGLGGFGTVYRGYLHDTEVAIKVVDSNSRQGLDVFLQELETLRQMRHPNLVKLIGACISLRSLVFEFLPNGSVEDCLRKNPSILTWQVRTHIVYQICSALVFIHSKKPRPLVHGDVKPSNILLDAYFNIKLGDFGVCNFLPKGTMTDAFLQTNTIRGTEWYIDPDSMETGLLTTACDLYAYGVTILRLLTGMKAAEILWKVRIAYEKNSLMTIVDPTAGNWPLDVSEHLARLGLKCCRKIEKRKPAPTEEIMKELRDFLAANDNFKTFLLALDKNSSILSSTSNVKAFTYLEIECATNGLSESSKIGKGSYGSVYKGYLHNTEVAVKMLDAKSEHGSKEFNQELEVLSQMQHPNLVKLIGVCFNNHSLVYEFVRNGSLEDCLKKSPGLLTWHVRTRIVYDICLGLIFLHSNEPQPVLHGDLKPANILLDDNFHVKLADFGLCRFLPEGTNTKNFHNTKNFQGTDWYVDPDYLGTGNLSPGCDVYSFGVTILVILTGASPVDLVGKVYEARKSLMKMVDSTAGTWPDHVAKYLARIGLRCCEPKGRTRSEIMMEMSSNLKKILDKIGS